MEGSSKFLRQLHRAIEGVSLCTQSKLCVWSVLHFREPAVVWPMPPPWHLSTPRALSHPEGAVSQGLRLFGAIYKGKPPPRVIRGKKKKKVYTFLQKQNKYSWIKSGFPGFMIYLVFHWFLHLGLATQPVSFMMWLLFWMSMILLSSAFWKKTITTVCSYDSILALWFLISWIPVFILIKAGGISDIYILHLGRFADAFVQSEVHLSEDNISLSVQ